jgi:glycosyltransferase involved in cell wall biosynthesis
VSVALCTFNGASFIAEQLESILAQDPPPYEIVVGDDGSTDETLAIVRETARSYPATTVTILPAAARLGVTANFERTIAATTGELIALSDQDDAWHAGRLSRLLREFESADDLLLVHHDAALVDARGVSTGMTLFDSLRVRSSERAAIADGRAFEAYLRRNLATGATVMFRRSLLQFAIPFPSQWVHDEWLAIIAAAVGRVELLDESLIDYRQHGGNQIGAANPTLKYRLSRMLQARGDRLAVLAVRSSILTQRLGALDGTERWRELAARKARFEERRARYARVRIARIPRIVAQLGSYPQLSSQGIVDAVRDAIQPA